MLLFGTNDEVYEEKKEQGQKVVLANQRAANQRSMISNIGRARLWPKLAKSVA